MTRFVAAAAALAMVAVPAFAEKETFVFDFEYKPAEVATAAGAAEAYDRLYSQALDACEANSGRQTLQTRRFARECADNLVNDVIAEANRPMLTAVHYDVTGEAPAYAQIDGDTSSRNN